jgi:tetratricopeptide (TPR) repeat protein
MIPLYPTVRVRRSLPQHLVHVGVETTLGRKRMPTERDIALRVVGAAVEAVAGGAASEDVMDLMPASVARAWCNHGAHVSGVRPVPEKLRGSSSLATAEIGPSLLQMQLNAINASRGTHAAPLLNAATIISEELGDTTLLTRVAANLLRRQLGAGEAYVAAALHCSPAEEATTKPELVRRALAAQHGDCAEAWAVVLPLPFVFEGIECKTRVDQLRHACACKSATPAHWYELGQRLEADDKVEVKGREVSRRDAFIKCLRLDSTFADAFYALAFDLRPDESLTVPYATGRVLASVPWLLSMALTHKCTHEADAWYGLMHTVGSFTVQVNERPIDLAACCARVISFGDEGRAAEAWELLLGCFATSEGRGLESSLANKPGTELDRVKCAAQVLKRNPDEATAWLLLAESMKAQRCGWTEIRGRKVTLETAYVEAIDRGADGPRVWTALAGCMRPWQRLSVARADLGLTEVAWRGIKGQPSSLDAWHALAPHFERNRFAELPDGRILSVKDWCVQILSCNPQDARAYYHLAHALGHGGDGALLPDGRILTARECLIAALTCDRGMAAAWALLGANMGSHEQVKIGEATMSKQDVTARAVSGGEYDVASNWVELGQMLQLRDGTATVGKRVVKAEDCFRRALELDPTNADASRLLDKAVAGRLGVVVEF